VFLATEFLLISPFKGLIVAQHVDRDDGR